ncbi:hypothetical protein H4219_004768 [Mycoemilia scoparia]|uniref:Uncharacterized protein n=1 Tax=Mycoemilia scoparia TaxID=417184 RepID=A0A9W7ZYP5_9FUNG|nr:hypothetical protein H4219_004768 [Mycoemilia scoparia]
MYKLVSPSHNRHYRRLTLFPVASLLAILIFAIIGHQCQANIINPLLDNGKLPNSFNFNTSTDGGDSNGDSLSATAHEEDDHDDANAKSSKKDKEFCNKYINVCVNLLNNQNGSGSSSSGVSPTSTAIAIATSVAGGNSTTATASTAGGSKSGWAHCTSNYHHFCCSKIPDNTVVIDECPDNINIDDLVIKKIEEDSKSNSSDHEHEDNDGGALSSFCNNVLFGDIGSSSSGYWKFGFACLVLTLLHITF